MTFDEVLDRVRSLLESKGRVTYGSLKRRFEIDDDYLVDVTAELVEAEQVARDEKGKVLVWPGCGRGRGKWRKRGSCSPPSTIGSRKGLIRRTSKTPKSCSLSCHNP